jgi:hypothetical protein
MWQYLVASPWSDGLKGQAANDVRRRKEEEAALAAADHEDLETAAEKATVAVSQIQPEADCFQLRCHSEVPPQPI